MEKTDTAIWDFIANTDVFTLATCHRGKPYCTPCFYAFDREGKYLIFKSGIGTRHVTELLLQPLVAGSILPKTLSLGKVKGIQFSGRSLPLREIEGYDRLKKLYYKQFPIALPMAGQLWVIELDDIKMTDNTLGIGNKLRWERTQLSTKLN
jgi:uncharacterized protein YhbP (UPF0306 family)